MDSANASLADGRGVTWQPTCLSCGNTHPRPPKEWTCLRCRKKVWQPDGSTDGCACCGVRRLSRLQRHHCRQCGHLVCKACSGFVACIPEWNTPRKFRICSLCAIPSDAAPGRSGYLTKEASSRGIFGGERFQRRWFQIRGDTLVYGVLPTSGFHGAINLRGAQVIDDPGHRHAFRILGPNLQRGYLLLSDSAEDKAGWISALQSLLASRANVSSVSRMTSVADDSFTVTPDLSASSGYYAKFSAGPPSRPVRSAWPPSSPASFAPIGVVSATTGSFVLLARRRDNASICVAIKGYSVDHVLSSPRGSNHSVEAVQTERAVLACMASCSDAPSDRQPALPRLLHAFETPTHLLLVTEWCAGGNMLLHMRACLRVAEERLRFFAVELVTALDTLHRANFLHGALHPEHVMIKADGHLVLVGLNSACMHTKGAQGLPVAAVHGGLPIEYASPEMLSGTGLTAAHDYWCLGVLLYELAAGAPPFRSVKEGELGEAEVKMRITNRAFEYPVHFSSELKQLISRLICSNPTARLSSPSELLADPFCRTAAVGDMGRAAPDYVPDARAAATEPMLYCDQRFTGLPIPSFSTAVVTSSGSQSHFTGYGYPPPNSVASPGGARS